MLKLYAAAGGIAVIVLLLFALTVLLDDETESILSTTMWNHELQVAYDTGAGNNTFLLIREEFDCHPHWPYYGKPQQNFFEGDMRSCKKNLNNEQNICKRAQRMRSSSFRPLVWLTTESNARGVSHLWSKCHPRHYGVYYVSQCFDTKRAKWMDIPMPTFTYPHPGYPKSREENKIRCSNAKYDAAFKGQSNSPERQALLPLRNNPKYIIEENSRMGERDERMSELLHDARFGFVPAGDGWHSYRLAETMAMGVVPIILADGLALPFEDILDWSEFSIRISMNDVQRIPQIIDQAQDRACIMSDRVFEVYHRYMANATQIMRGVEESILKHALQI